MSVHVEDTTLDLTLPATNSDTTNGIYTMTLPDGNSEYITATNYYQDVTYTKSNDNIRINKQVMNYDQIAFLITPLVTGTGTLTFTDNEGNTKDVLVTV